MDDSVRSPSAQDPDQAEALAPTVLAPTRIVAIGASAGGLESLQQLFAAVPDNTGMAFVVVQHLSPDFKSLMPDLLGRQTRMPVLAVNQDMVLRQNTVYVLSAGYSVELEQHRLKAIPRVHDGELNLPINRFFGSLVDRGDQAAAVVLSGTGQDGMAGAKLVKKAGGLVIAQTPGSARFDSMPRAVIDSGVVDIIALPAEIGRALVQWQDDPIDGRKFTSEAMDGDSMMTGPYGPVLQVLQKAFDLDFAHYKSGTLMRRIDRWLTAGGRPISPGALAAHLADSQAETDRMFGDLMIGVTSFFRDAEVFESLRKNGIEPMIDALGERDQLRIWCCACSTGEEAYTLAILACEAFERRGKTPRLRVLATDVHAASVQRASAGVYSEASLEAMPQHLRDKYFMALPNGHYRVTEALRRQVVFSVQNVLRDAGFQRIDIVTCRNLLIYLRPPAQAQVLASFHLALHAGGMLLLGKSEMPSEHAEAFVDVDEHAHLFKKRPGLQLPMQARPLFGLPGTQRPAMSMPLDNRASYRLQEVLAQRYVPSGFLVNQNDELVYVFGDAGRYLQAAPGRFGGTMFNLLGGGLRTAVTMSLRKAAQTMSLASVSDVVADDGEPHVRLRVDVDPIADRTLPHHYFMVRLTPMVAAAVTETVTLLAPDEATARHIAEIEGELLQTREALQRSIEDLEAANEELQAGNEELMAANEELQSSNEELHALNEELYSVNSEHEMKIQELRDTSADLNNLIRATELPIIFLDLEARLRLFTPPATKLFPLRPDDIGRELQDLVPRESDASLFEDLSQTLVGGDTKDTELRLKDGRVMRRRVTPYRTDLGVTTGLVIVYVDVSQEVLLRERKLEEAHQDQLNALVQSVPHLMWTCTAEGLCDFLSPQWVAYTGLAADPQLGYGWLEQICPDDREPLSATWQHSVDTAQPMRTRFRIRRHDGVYRWFDTQAVPLLNGQGKVVRWYGSNTDVHDVVMLQQALEERERFMQLVADNANGMIGYWDANERNRFANAHYLAWFGKTPEQMQGATLKETLGDEVYAQNKPYIDAVLAGQPQHFERSFLARADGQPGHLWAEYHPHVVDGKVQGFIATATDITKVQEARLLSARVFQVSPVAKMIVNAQGNIHDCNPAAGRLTGYSTEELTGMSLDMLLPASVRQRHKHYQQAFLASETDRPMGNGRAFPLVRADGSSVDVEIELAVVTLEGEKAAIVCIREVAMSPHALKRLDLALQARNAFLAQMSHEIRTPLNAILGMAQLLEIESPTPTQLDRLRRIEEASNLLLGLINDILDFSKMEAGRIQLSKEPFELPELIDRSLAIVADRAKLKQLALQVGIAPNTVLRLIGDERRIEQILVNLLTNAIKFTNAGQIAIRVSTAVASDHRIVLRMEVEDTGIGIAPEDIDQLFTPFRQLQQGMSRRFGGTGLGLSICRQLARAMHGDCLVRSAVGQGSVFSFTVQVDRNNAQLPADDPETAPGELLGERRYPDKQVLVVEDNPINAEVVRELLHARLDLQVSLAESGMQALAMAREHVYDLVLMDVQMPEMDGLETTRRMRKLPGYRKVPILALTANVHAEDVNACLGAGMNGHVGKPLIIEQFLPMLADIWDKKRS